MLYLTAEKCKVNVKLSSLTLHTSPVLWIESAENPLNGTAALSAEKLCRTAKAKVSPTPRNLPKYLLMVKTHGPRLAPFVATLILYFSLVRQDPQGELWTTVLKCLPIVALMFYVVANGFSLKKDYRRSLWILLGLVFSCGGDALLNVNLFPFGMVSFGVAHVFYICAFGWKPLKWPIGLALYVAVSLFVYFVHQKLDEILIIGVPIYCYLIITMLWRALARAVDAKNFLTIFCAVGAVLFVVSDALIAVTMFVGVPLPCPRLQIMITYYAAQFAIALSIADDGPQSFRSYRRKIK
ncbi:lysoplasmalogenase-like protein TMEM86A [Drosophila miranda]|uniref:lysoplasmalogenase-like protein TMEM86A n=1 Tax=Drosophila miranda TaxID=7229 RepID=UPI00143F174F|nr:lysoplasmalogenase-like protein TMEM86A [Drosophila miranda]